MSPKPTTVPALRFPRFDAEWDETTLGGVTKWSSGGTPAKDNPEYWNGDIPWMTASSMHGRYYS